MVSGKLRRVKSALQTKFLDRIRWRSSVAVVGSFWLLSSGMASEPFAEWDVRFPSAVQPPWFGPVTSQPALNLHVWRAGLRVPAAGGGDLSLTLVFRQAPGGFARVIWQGPSRVVTLCANLFEQAAPLHQRTFLLRREMLGAGGQLYVESTGPGPCLERVELQWVEPRVFSPADAQARLTTSSGRWWTEADLRADPGPAPADQIQRGLVDALLEAGPLTFQPGQGARLFAILQGTPAQGRIRAQIAGLLPGDEPQLWVNGSPLAAVAVEMPRLDDPGYRQSQGEGWKYGGWRSLTAYVPPGCLRSGENQLDWATPAGVENITLRNVRLEVMAESAWSTPNFSAPPIPKPVPAAPVVPALPVPTAPLRMGLSSAHADVGLRPE